MALLAGRPQASVEAVLRAAEAFEAWLLRQTVLAGGRSCPQAVFPDHRAVRFREDIVPLLCQVLVLCQALEDAREVDHGDEHDPA